MSNPDFPVEVPDVFGQIVTAADVRNALDVTVQTWAATYIAAMGRRTNQPLSPFGSWSALYTDRALPADLTAAYWSQCWTTDPKSPPQRQGDGWWRASWIAQSHIALYGTNWDDTADLIALYGAAVRAAVLQHRSLGGFATDTDWVGEAMLPQDRQARRTVQELVIQWRVLVPHMVNDFPKPTVNEAPGTQDGTFDTVVTTLSETVGNA